MRKLMREGKTFKAAHTAAQKEVGKRVYSDGLKKNGYMLRQVNLVVVRKERVVATLLADLLRELVVRHQRLQEK